MSEPILNALVQLFALIGDIHDDTVISAREKDVIRAFLARQLNFQLTQKYMKLFEEYLSMYNSERITKGSLQDRKRTSLNAMRILSICEKINEELQQKQKVYVLVQLIEFISLGEEVTENELDFLHTVGKAFFVPDNEYENLKCFIMNGPGEVKDKWNILVADSNQDIKPEGQRHLLRLNLNGALSFLYLPSTNTYVLRYSGTDDIYLNGQNITANLTYFFDTGSTIRGTGLDPVYYSEVVSIITGAEKDNRIYLRADNVTFKFSNSNNGIHNLDFYEESGHLVGILGGSGVGKSTTLSILNGTLQPQEGKVTINGYDLYDETDKKKLSGIIGYVPQDDLLIEELTVFENLYYNARLCLSNLDDAKIILIVNKILDDFDLIETRDLKVGSPLKKVISGGQRKRVNIALELMREPAILFVDEPTSGLSSVDSEKVMNLLKEQTYKGRLVIINIHQPGSDLYKMFDKIMIIDKGGFQIFYGNPSEAIIYFKTHSNHANPDEDQCISCGNINTDQILQIIESKVVDEHGRATQLRRVSPEEWADLYKKNSKALISVNSSGSEKLPENIYSIPGKIEQSIIYFKRDLVSKLADRQYLAVGLLGPAILSLLLAYFTRYNGGNAYTFRLNENIMAFIFMCVITSMFFGLMVSSEEIIRDRKILKREAFLNLSWVSYLNSKIMILFILSAIQTFSFVLIGNLILGIKGMTLFYWLVLFTTSCFANVLGLCLSSAFNSVIAVYILIPFIIIPQLLFSGVLVPFDKLHLGKNKTHEYVPVIGDLMTARWAYEAIVIKQFRDNGFERLIFQHNVAEARNVKYNRIIDQMKRDISASITDSKAENEESPDVRLSRIKKYLVMLSEEAGKDAGSLSGLLVPEEFNSQAATKINSFLDELKKSFTEEIKSVWRNREAVISAYEKENGAGSIVKLQEQNDNESLSNSVRGLNKPGQLVIGSGDKYIPKMDLAYLPGTSRFGRAHFYAPSKMVGNYETDTFWFNLLVIWIESVLLYLALCLSVPSKCINWLGSIRFRRQDIPL